MNPFENTSDKRVITNMLKLVNNLFLSRSGSNSLRVQVSLFVYIYNNSVQYNLNDKLYLDSLV
jgi:hypothetical protein